MENIFKAELLYLKSITVNHDTICNKFLHCKVFQPEVQQIKFFNFLLNFGLELKKLRDEFY